MPPNAANASTIRCLPPGGRAIAAAGSTAAGAGITGRIRPFASTPAPRRSSPSIRAKARSAKAAPPALSTRSPTWWWATRPPRRTSPLPQAAARPAEAAFQAAVIPAAVSPAQAPLRASNPCFGARACTVGGFLRQPRSALLPKNRSQKSHWKRGSRGVCQSARQTQEAARVDRLAGVLGCVVGDRN